MVDFDFQHLKQQIGEAARAAFLEVLAEHRTEEIYSFALYSDEGAMTVCPAINTLTYLATQPPEDQLYAKYEPAEWQYEMQGAAAQFNDISRQLRTYVRNEALAGNEFTRFRRQLYATCVEVLADLRQQQFFEKVAGREVFLLFTVSDGETSARELAQIANQLNSNAYRDEYLAWLAQGEA